MLNGEIGDFITIARRNGDNWFIGSITDENQRELEIKLDFLEPGKDYMATGFSDSEKTDLEDNPTAYKVEMYPVNSESIIVMGLTAAGGQAIVIKAIENNKEE